MTTSTATTTGDGTAQEARRMAGTGTLILPTDHPGRWLGGAIGGLVSLAAALVATRIETGPGIFGWADWSIVGLLGIPIAFALGRALFPLARGAGWRRALGAGTLLGWIAPPLGAIEILGGLRLLELGNLSNSIGGPAALVLLPLAIPFSFMAIVMTIPVGLAWAILVRLVPDDALVALRVPRPLERIGVGHALIVISIGLLLVELAVRS